MHAPLWIARRFSFARKRFRIVNIISAISFIGIVIGVSTLLIVMSVLNGFQKLAEDLFLGIEPPVAIISAEYGGLHVEPAFLDSLSRIDGVAAIEPYVEGEAMLSVAGKSEMVMIRGIGDLAQQRLMEQSGRSTPYVSPGEVSIGELLAYRMRLAPMQKVRLFSPDLVSLGLDALADPWLMPALAIPSARFGSVFQLQKIFDDRYVLSTESFARNVLLMGKDSWTGIGIRYGGKGTVTGIVNALEDFLAVHDPDKKCAIRTLDQKYSAIFTVMELEKWASFAVLMLIVIVASLSLTGALTMTAIDKQKDLFSLRCLGMERRDLMSVFVMQGAFTGIAGTIAGALLAWGVCALQQHYGLVPLPSRSAFIIDAYPVSIEAGDFIAVSASTLMLCILVSLMPARKAAAIAQSRSAGEGVL